MIRDGAQRGRSDPECGPSLGAQAQLQLLQLLQQALFVVRIWHKILKSNKILPVAQDPESTDLLLCAVRVPGEPVLTTATTCGTTVRSSLGSAGLLQWSKTQAYTSNIYCISIPSRTRQLQTDAG